MSVRPIDIQISVQRTNEYAKEVDIQNQKVNINQFANANEFQRAIDQAQRQVVPSGNVHHKKVNREHNTPRRHPRYVKKEQVKENKKGEGILNGEVEIKGRDKGFNIDIRI
ncbi:hypothetical protein JOD02_000231 [Caldicoprobacter guelmensis]|uniref:hypothetical protein n=1 Tax=Caldicoprobacter guelmensis TaxID=1170224 RepID=UPI001958B39A|nr:hypothetical protein [Caldicoprobacter guelmensis]MBM7581408.1 hypothetical protein [Caldicoprobacter guelmensis]